MFEGRAPLQDWADELRTCSVVWTVLGRDVTRPAHEQGADLSPGPALQVAAALRLPNSMGFRLVERWQWNVTQVVKYHKPDEAGPGSGR